MLKPDIIIDFMQADVDGRTTVATSDLPAGTKKDGHIVVSDHDAEPAVARIVDIQAERTSILVLPGAAEDNSALLQRGSATPTV